jgi:hypothetical protein
MDTKRHLTFGGSTAHRWLRCAGSVGLCATVPNVETEPMKRGTRAHRLLEWALNSKRTSVINCKGKCLVAHDPLFDGDDVEAVQEALGYIHGILDANPDATMFVERQVKLNDEVGGTADVVIYVPSKRLLYVIDYKHGAGIFVSAFDNRQLKLYGCATVMGFTEGAIDTVQCVIVQPRHWAGAAVREAPPITPADLLMYVDDVEAAVAMAKSTKAQFVPGEEQCYSCPAAPVCQTLHNAIVDGITFGPTWERQDVTGNVPDTYAGTTLTIPSADAIRNNPEVLGEVLRAAGLIRAWLGAVEDHAEAHIRAGHPLPGFKLVAVQARKKWADEAGARKFLDEETLLGPDDYMPREMLTVTQVANLLKKGNKEGEALLQKLAAFSISKSSGMKLVPESAAGEAIPVAEVLAIAGGDAGDVIL